MFNISVLTAVIKVKWGDSLFNLSTVMIKFLINTTSSLKDEERVDVSSSSISIYTFLFKFDLNRSKLGDINKK